MIKFDPKTITKPVLSMTKGFFERVFPKPTTKNFTTQMGCHFEEVAEMIAEVTPLDQDTHIAFLDAKIAIQHLADHLKTHPGCALVQPENYIKYLDALCDQIVTATGCAHMADMDIVGALDETNRENFSKFGEDGNPIFDQNGKMIKGPNYTVSDLTAFV